jgi:hypothetical protein
MVRFWRLARALAAFAISGGMEMVKTRERRRVAGIRNLSVMNCMRLSYRKQSRLSGMLIRSSYHAHQQAPASGMIAVA